MTTSPPSPEKFTGALSIREQNGYDDSDWYIAYWDGEQVTESLYDTTRGVMKRLPVEWATDEELLAARAWAVPVLVSGLKWRAEKRILEPGPAALRSGLDLQLLKAVTFKDKTSGMEVKAAKGDKGRVFWFGNFGTFYRNGYNQPDRTNTRVGLEMENGDRLFTSLKNLRLTDDLPLEEDLQREAEALSWKGKFGLSRDSLKSHLQERLQALRPSPSLTL